MVRPRGLGGGGGGIGVGDVSRMARPPSTTHRTNPGNGLVPSSTVGTGGGGYGAGYGHGADGHVGRTVMARPTSSRVDAARTTLSTLETTVRVMRVRVTVDNYLWS